MKYRSDYDGAWKALIEKFFYQMLARCLPELYNEADTGRPPEFMDKELREIVNRLEKNVRRAVDFLVRVPMKNGHGEMVWLHIEIQGRGGGDLAERMFKYVALIYARHRRMITALAVITARRGAKEAGFYSSSLYGTELTYKFNRLVVPDVDPKELEASENPFDLALLAAVRAISGGKDDALKSRYLKELIKILSERKLEREEKRILLSFMESITNIRDEALWEEIWEYEEQLEKEGKIVFVSYAERVWRKKGVEEGLEKGRERGREEEKIEIAKNMLFDGIAVDVIEKYTGLSAVKITGLRDE